jgi:hypothetical protein
MILLSNRCAWPRTLGVLSAALVLAFAVSAHADGASPESASAEQEKQAQERYEQGVQHYKANHFDEAAEAFRASVEIVASPNARLMYARALRESGKIEQAYEQLALTQQEASELSVRLPKYASTGESAEAEMTALLKRTAAIRVEIRGADPGSVEVVVGERSVPRKLWRAIAVKPGTYAVTARAADGRRARVSLDVEQGQVADVELELTANGAGASAAPAAAGSAVAAAPAAEADQGAARSDHPLRPWAFVAGGIGLVGVATFAVAGAMSRSTFATLEDDCPNKQCPADSQQDIDRGKTEQLVANVGLAVGAVGLAAGVALFVVDLGSGSATPATSVRVAASTGGVRVAGSF